MRQHHFLSHLVPNRTIKLLGRACALTVLLCLSNSSFAENKLLATEVSNAEGWREFHIAVDAKRYAWCGPGTKLVVDTKKDGIKLIDVATWKVQEIPKGSNPDCSQDGKFIYFRVVQPGSVKFVQMATATWTRREFDAPVYGTIQISANGRYIFFTSSGTGQMVGDGLYYLDVPSGKVFTIHKQRLPTFKSENRVSPGNKYFVAPPGWEGKSVTLSGGEKLTAIPLPIAPSGKLFDENYMTDDWVWTPDDRKLVTLNWRTRTVFLVRVYDLQLGKHITSALIQENVNVDSGAYLQFGAGKYVYIRADNQDNTGAQLLQINLDRETTERKYFLKGTIKVDFSAAGLTVFSRRSGAKVDHLNTYLSQDPHERFMSIFVVDEKGRETSIRAYPFVNDPFVLSEAYVTRSGQAIVYGMKVKEFTDERNLVILIRN